MSTKDSYLTRAYKGGYIHTCVNRSTGKTEVRVQFPDGSSRDVPTVNSAKILLRAFVEVYQ